MKQQVTCDRSKTFQKSQFGESSSTVESSKLFKFIVVLEINTSFSEISHYNICIRNSVPMGSVISVFEMSLRFTKNKKNTAVTFWHMPGKITIKWQ